MAPHPSPLPPYELAAVRVRTLASSARVTLAETLHDGRRFPARGAVTEQGHPVVLVEPGSTLHTSLVLGQGGVAARLTLQAPRELGGHSLVRATLGACGRLTALPGPQLRAAAVAIAEHCPDEALFTALERAGELDAPVLAGLDLANIDCRTMSASTTVDVRDYFSAGVDPLAPAAENLIEHINLGHPGLLAPCLATLLAAPVRVAWLWEVDSEGITFLAELPEPAGASLVALAWPEPITDPTVLGLALHELLRRGQVCGCEHRCGDR